MPNESSVYRLIYRMSELSMHSRQRYYVCDTVDMIINITIWHQAPARALVFYRFWSFQFSFKCF